ncbi:hypothetical protein G7Y89_g907 [Cudoniella acicularis]|uniref:DUF676 domain-containing protein n=1 Tax=Cudoniella acicularis TaxID=354080 RepID=A0A8H4RZ42_9HELO|nr:hypothetical protein G7Y89_g907 [Cudoniella acicularis]
MILDVREKQERARIDSNKATTTTEKEKKEAEKAEKALSPTKSRKAPISKKKAVRFISVGVKEGGGPTEPEKRSKTGQVIKALLTDHFSPLSFQVGTSEKSLLASSTMGTKSPRRRNITEIFRIKGRRSSPEEGNDVVSTASASTDSSTTLTPSTQSVLDGSENQKSIGNIGSLVLSSPSKNDVAFDIWLIHGLTGDRHKTWLHPNGTYWPSLLTSDFPQARVITYGYDANIARFEKNLQNSSSEGLHSYGQSLAFAIRNSRQNQDTQDRDRSSSCKKRPIYFIAHSLGGLVVEQALLICIGPDESLHDVAASTAGIMFMGTPHQGSHLARWGSALGKLVPDNIRTVNQRALSVLKRDSEVCRNLENAFQEQAKNGRFRHVRLFSFYETIALGGLGGMIVEEASAVLKGDGKCPIHGTHMSMVRFAGREDDGYCKIKGQLLAWLELLQVKLEVAGNMGNLIEPETREERARENKEGQRGVTMQGASFGGFISGGTINANQTAAGGNVYYYSRDRSSYEEETTGSEDN